jgi:integrase
VLALFKALSGVRETVQAGIKGFRIHDWRHHFAVWILKRGGNLRALCQIAGWSSAKCRVRAERPGDRGFRAN